MNKILVAYVTMAGSTAEVAQGIAEELSSNGLKVDILPIQEVHDLGNYDAVVVGGPMIMGWHRGALRFLKKHRGVFQHKPLAVFMTAMSLTQTGEDSAVGAPVFVDEKLANPPQNQSSLTFRERYTRLSSYLRPIMNAVRPAKPASIGVFGGRLEYGRLKWWAVLFAMLVIQASPGERRNWPAIRLWAAGLPSVLQPATGEVNGMHSSQVPSKEGAPS
jgi:menaquinone-dependent protoporphyrinogen oxidase